MAAPSPVFAMKGFSIVQFFLFFFFFPALLASVAFGRALPGHQGLLCRGLAHAHGCRVLQGAESGSWQLGGSPGPMAGRLLLSRELLLGGGTLHVAGKEN